ncbi:hypothetical protein F9B82_01910 [Lacticaseibacillus casei]|nr:hypothetical protein F9B82_01910 [Lacticaseibacillus casei]
MPSALASRRHPIWPEIAKFGTARNLWSKTFLYCSPFIKLRTFSRNYYLESLASISGYICSRLCRSNQ